jgi:hypothetical protein
MKITVHVQLKEKSSQLHIFDIENIQLDFHVCDSKAIPYIASMHRPEEKRSIRKE